MSDLRSNLFGLYEKALPAYLSWEERLSFAKYAGYDFVEMSIDETDERLDRVRNIGGEKSDIVNAVLKTGIPVLTMCLSGNRRYPIGSKDEKVRKKGIEIIKGAIKLSVEIGVRVVQLAGYDEYYNPSDETTVELFEKSLLECVGFAERYGMMLAIETMDTNLCGSIASIMRFVNRINSPWLNVYPDIGNLSSRKVNINEDFHTGKDHIVVIHLKDTRENEFRRVGFGEGIVDFIHFFKLLSEMDYKGPFVIEMWSDDDLISIPDVKKAKEFIFDRLEEACPKGLDNAKTDNEIWSKENVVV